MQHKLDDRVVFSLLMPMISEAAVTTIQKIGLESRSVAFDDVMRTMTVGGGTFTVRTIVNGDLEAPFE